MKYLTLTLIFLMTFCSFSFAPGWELKKNENGIKVFTRVKEGSPLKEYKATVTINATMDAVLSVIKDVPGYVNWQYPCKEAKIVKQISDNEFISYTLNEAPWPIYDRDVVVRSVFHQQDDQTVMMTMDAIAEEGFVEPVNGVVRITKMVGKWWFKPVTDGIEITMQVHADPAGSIPKWLANSSVVDSPFRTLTNLKTLME